MDVIHYFEIGQEITSILNSFSCWFSSKKKQHSFNLCKFDSMSAQARFIQLN